jgi:hypothetical protein
MAFIEVKLSKMCGGPLPDLSLTLSMGEGRFSGFLRLNGKLVVMQEAIAEFLVDLVSPDEKQIGHKNISRKTCGRNKFVVAL